MADYEVKRYSEWDCEYGECLLIAVGYEVTVTCNYAACHIVDANHKSAFERWGKTHFGEAVE